MSGNGAQTSLDISAIADEAFGIMNTGEQIAPFSERLAGFDLPTAYQVTAHLRRLRLARGETPIGRKIGFTNRNIWPQYDVYAPIWGDMFDTTVSDQGTEIALAPFPEPKIEPEIAFGLSRPPEHGMDEEALLGCIEWAAQGFEIVQSIYPDWRFQPADTVAGFGMHGAFLLGEKASLPEIPLSGAPLSRGTLEDFSLTLLKDGAEIETGHASDVLGGPLTALRHLVEILATDPDNPPLTTGEIVTTGTITRAFDVAPGQTWQTRIAGLELPDLTVRLI